MKSNVIENTSQDHFKETEYNNMFGLYLGVFTVFHFLALLVFLKRKEEKHKGLGVDKRYIQAKKKKKARHVHMWSYTLEILTFLRPRRQEDHDFQASLCYIMRLCLGKH